MSFTKLPYADQQTEAARAIKEFMDCYDIEDTDEARSGIIDLLEQFDICIDACSHCGAMPMNTNCNNAGCDV